jgi:hypothetical protein
MNMLNRLQLAIILAITAWAGVAGGCRNPFQVDAAVRSPAGDLVAEVISHDAAPFTGKQGQRDYTILVRNVSAERDPETQLVLQVLGFGAPSVAWSSAHTLEAHLTPQSKIAVQRQISGVAVTVK